MISFESILVRADEEITGLFRQWNGYTSLIVIILVGLLTYALISHADPDIHPMLLARQAEPAHVRYPGQSPVFRSHLTPHGMPLATGLSVKDPRASMFAEGRDGDLCDIWRQAVSGVNTSSNNNYVSSSQSQSGKRGTILTVRGSRPAVEYSLDDITRQLNLIGRYLSDHGSQRVAIYLPNSTELITGIFACAFYGLSPAILPYTSAEDAVFAMLREAEADTIITAPGAFPFRVVAKTYPQLRHVIWVVDDGSKHLDWKSVPQAPGCDAAVTTWQDILSQFPANAGRDLPSSQVSATPHDVVLFWKRTSDKIGQIQRFSPANLVAAVAAQLAALPTVSRMGPTDLFLPSDSLANSHTLILTLAALYSNASVAFNSTADGAADLTTATRGIAPTIIVAPPSTLMTTHQETMSRMTSYPNIFAYRWQLRTLTEKAIMPGISLVSRINDSMQPVIGTSPGKLRLIYTAERIGCDSPRLSSGVLADLRILTRARIIYALTAPQVAGAVSQTNLYDYRVSDDEYCHFGSPLTSTEILLRDTANHKSADHISAGEIIVRGPCVVGGRTALGVEGKIQDDNTLTYA